MTHTNEKDAQKVSVQIYEGENPFVLEMASYLSANLADDLVGAYVHGSLGTYEEVPYSDFDALVILKNKAFESPEKLALIANKLNVAKRIMFDFDVLQHHGWFVLTELELGYYCEAYFPIELFKYAKSLFHDRGLELEVYSRHSISETRQAFATMATSISDRVRYQRYPANMYELKSFMSGFMLLPALYVQVRDGKGIYKKYSFEAARSDFCNKDWLIIDQVSTIRREWGYEISRLQKFLMSKPHYLSRLLAKKFSPTISPGLSQFLSPTIYSNMEKLALLMQEKLN